MKTLKLAMLAATAFTGAAWGKVEFATPFADGMVLQRDTELPVWGTADPGEKVGVSFAGATVETVADAEGRWRVTLPKTSASKEGRTLKANDVSIGDVLVGEVWFCAGQSNTEMPLVGGSPHFSDRQGRLVAGMTRNRMIRYVHAADYRWSETPKAKAGYPVVWKTFTPENLGAKPSFSAMGVYFALELYAALDVPIGIVGSYWGGTNIDAWTPREGYEGKDDLRDVAEWATVKHGEWNAATHKHGPVTEAHQQPTVLWNEMVAPWCPMAMRGFIWYQGCHNAGEAGRYRSKMHALYDGWSKAFANPSLKLYFVQLAPFSRSWWDIQLAQAEFAAEEPNAAMATTVDVGNSADIHPNEKGTVGKRLAALALSRDYGFRDLVAEPPTLKAVCSEEGRLVLSFDHADGWYVYDQAWGVDCGFEIAGEDGRWAKAYLANGNGGNKTKIPWQTKGEVSGRDLILAADGVEKPMKVRFLHGEPWTGVLYASSGIPLGPFEAEVKR